MPDDMTVLVLGGGGREHALAWALDRSPSVGRVVTAPGNAGTARVGANRVIDAEDPAAVVALAHQLGADLVIVGPEGPLGAGVVDALTAAGFAAFGPTAAAARIEGSKAFAKEVMAAAGVPTAAHWAGADVAGARTAVRSFDAPYVVKADGLAAGKGVRICGTLEEADQAIGDALVRGVFGDAGATLVIEEHLDGPECSLFGLCDGRTVVPLQPAQDYKRALDGDRGPNTGGMGAYSPVPALSADDVERLRAQVLQPVVDELGRRGTPFTGVLYAGLVLTADGPKVLEFNARFGDPETQVVLPRLESDLGELLGACAAGRLAELQPPRFTDRAAVTVVLASAGYPGDYARGLPISGLDADLGPDAIVFHAGTRAGYRRVVTAGGRVLAVTALADDLQAARARAYAAADRIAFEGAQRRRDIAAHPQIASA